ncbi:MAG: hypothetical protein V1763_00885 [Parcubacteria group bacterium]
MKKNGKRLVRLTLRDELDLVGARARREFQRTAPKIRFAKTTGELEVRDDVIGKDGEGTVVMSW